MMTTQKIQSMLDENFVMFSLTRIDTYINKQGYEKKKPINLPSWKDINADNFRDYLDPKRDTAFAVVTGKLSGITVVDFDNMSEYIKLTENFPEIKNHRSIQTKNGIHIYYKYNPTVLDTTNGMNSYAGVDIRNDNGIVFAPPTTYKLKNGNYVEYKDLGGEIVEIPDFILNDLKKTKEQEKEEKQKTKEQEKEEKKIQKIQEKKYGKDEKEFEKSEKEMKVQKENDLIFIEKSISSGKLNNKAFSDSWNDWRDIGFIIKHTDNGERGFKLFDAFSMLNKDKYDEKTTKDFWNGIKTVKEGILPLTVATMKSWIIKYAKNDIEASEILFLELKDILKSVDGRLFYLQNNIWLCDETAIEDNVIHYVLNSNIYTRGKKEPISFVQNYSSAVSVYKTLIKKIKAENKDDDMYEKFHTTTKGKICFDDGVLFLEEQKFVLWQDIPKFTIYSTVKINRNYNEYFKNPNQEIIAKIVEKILRPMFNNKYETALHFLARAIGGHSEDKRWATYLGNRMCGKGLIYALLRGAFKKYVETFELGNMLYNRKSAGMENLDCSKKLYWLLDLEFVRLGISQEVPDHKSGLIMNGKQLKKVNGGGDTIVARRNYDRHDSHITLDVSLFILGNFSLICDSADCEETLIEFSSVMETKQEHEIEQLKKDGIYDENRHLLADGNLKNICNENVEWHNAIVHLLYMSYKKVSVPIKVVVSEDETNVLKVLNKLFEFTGDEKDAVPVEIVYDKLSEYDKKKITNELQAKNVFKKKDNRKDSAYKNKWCFWKLKLIVEEEEGF